MPTVDTNTYSCGDRARIEQNKAALIIIIQNSGTQTLKYELKTYTGPSPAVIGGIIGGVVGAIVLIGLGIFAYKKYQAKKLASQLNEDSHRSLV